MTAPFDDGADPFGADAGPRHTRFRLEDFNTLKAGPFFWRVKKLWPRVGVCFLGGPTMTGKSFWMLSASASICLGLPVLGRKSIPAGVVYVGAEDAGGLRLRIEAMRKEIGPLPEDRFKFIGAAPDLTQPEDVEDLKAALLEAKRLMASRGVPLGLVVIDTMSAATPGADENTAKDMGPVLKALQDTARELETLIILVAHTGKDETRGLRGWSGLLANADGLIMLEDAEGSEVFRGRVVKVKNGRAGDRFAFTLRVVVLGQDEDGDDIDTCVIEEADPPDRSNAGRPPTKAMATGRLILNALHLCLDEFPIAVQAPGAFGAKGVEIQRLRDRAYRIGVGPTEPSVSADGEPAEDKRLKRKWQDQRKADFDRGLAHLLSIRALRRDGDLVWEPSTKKRS
jgi:hypothetical protein